MDTKTRKPGLLDLEEMVEDDSPEMRTLMQDRSPNSTTSAAPPSRPNCRATVERRLTAMPLTVGGRAQLGSPIIGVYFR
jgi:hypothetical protein